MSTKGMKRILKNKFQLTEVEKSAEPNSQSKQKGCIGDLN